MPDEDLIEFASEFWDVIWKQFPEWEMVRKRRMPAGEVRAEFIHSHGVALHAIARVGNHLLKHPKRGWQKRGRLRPPREEPGAEADSSERCANCSGRTG